MDRKSKILEAVSNGTLGFAEAVARLAAAEGAVADLGVAKIDHARMARCGMPEFVYGAGKNVEQLLTIVPEILRRNGSVLVTRVEPAAGRALLEKVPQGIHDAQAKVFAVQNSARELHGNVAVVSAGTSDLGVALEAQYTLEECGVRSELVTDVGVAGIERLFASLDRLRRADVCIVIAGMEGALPSVVGGLVRVPVIAVPTSVGYGASFGGLAALLGMLNSCAAGVTVVNVDNGFGAACAAARIINCREK